MLGEEKDFVFIGHAYVVCAVKSLTHIASHSVVTIHDFQRTRDEYTAHPFFYDVTEKLHVPGKPGIAFLNHKPRFCAFQGNASTVQPLLKLERIYSRCEKVRKSLLCLTTSFLVCKLIGKWIGFLSFKFDYVVRSRCIPAQKIIFSNC